MTMLPSSNLIEVNGLKLHYLEAGPEDDSGDPILLLHGWPTSSYLWRNVIPEMATRHRVFALDFPGFGRSDKPLDVSYSFRYFNRILDSFTEQLGIDRLGLVVHDLGGPVGLHWACQQPQRISKLALLNTLIYPQLSWAVIAFTMACRLPGMRSALTSRRGLRATMRFGVYDKSRITDETLAAVQAPFNNRDSRRALCQAALGLNPKGLDEIERGLPLFKVPVRVIYGENDRILPDVAKTMARVKHDLPQAHITPLVNCGHFLQEERGPEIGALLNEFFTK